MKNEHGKVIFLLGFMGSGKSHEGNFLSQQLGLPFIDLDQWIEKQEGKTIAAIFKEHGEPFFRQLEREALKAVYGFLLAEQHHEKPDYIGIVATGGGTPCFYDNIQWMNEHGKTIWLNLSVDVLLKRLCNETSKRPLLHGKDELELTQFIQDKLQERKPYYSQAQLEFTGEIQLVELIQKNNDA